MGVIYDGAFRGVHRDTLARLGLLVINRQHGSVKPRAHELLRFGRCRHDLWCDQGRRLPMRQDVRGETEPCRESADAHRARAVVSARLHVGIRS